MQELPVVSSHNQSGKGYPPLPLIFPAACAYLSVTVRYLYYSVFLAHRNIRQPVSVFYYLNLLRHSSALAHAIFHLFHNIAGSLIQISSPYHNLPENLGTTRYEGIHHIPVVNNNHFIFMGFSGILTHFRYLNAYNRKVYFYEVRLCRTI